MKICDITQFYSPVGGGVGRYIAEKKKYIQNHTEDEHLLLIPGDKTEIIRDGRFTTCKIASPIVNQSSQYRILLNLRQMRKFLLQEKPDLIESGDPYQLSWEALKVGKRLNIPVFGFYHSHFLEAYLRTITKYSGPWLANRITGFAKDYVIRLYNKFDTTFVPSAFLAKLLQEWGISNTTQVHLGIDPEVFSPGNSVAIKRKKINVPDDAFLLLYIGRLSGEKNVSLLLEAFHLLNQKCPDKFSFLIIGDGQLRNEIIQARSKLPLLRWIPYCRESVELVDYYRMANLFVHPGVCETFGLVSLESQACGCPVVGIKGSCMDANIFAGHKFWSKKNTPQDLCDAILKFSQQDTQKLGLAASQTVRKRYAWPRIFKHIWNCYSRGIAQRHSQDKSPSS